MFRSLRFRLPALFLVGIALTGLVSTAIAFGLCMIVGLVAILIGVFVGARFYREE